MKTRSSRELIIIRAAIDGLTEYYTCSLAQEFASTVKVPDTGNDQNDYENVRDQIERQANKYEQRSDFADLQSFLDRLAK